MQDLSVDACTVEQLPSFSGDACLGGLSCDAALLRGCEAR